MNYKAVSVVVALNNEESNVPLFYKRIKTVLESIKDSYELILVDDGSKDETYLRMLEIHRNDMNVKTIKLKKNIGQALSLIVGLSHAVGSVIVTMDADLQHNPEDIPRFLDSIAAGYDMVNGWRRKRKDNFFTRVIPAVMAKKMVSLFFKTSIHDINSNFRAYRREVLDQLISSGECIRFAPLLLQGKASVIEIVIGFGKRKRGKTHFGFWPRVNRVIKDIGILYDIKTDTLDRHYFVPDNVIRAREFHA